MRKGILLLFAIILSFGVTAQEKNVYQFTNKIELDATETKDQCRTGTCWSYSTVSFLESELIRMGKGEHNLSEMFNVRVTYPKKADKYVRYQGKYQFGPGSLCHDVINAMRDYGIVPDAVYSGLPEGEDEHNHGEMDAMLEAMLKAVVDKRTAAYGDQWRMAVEGVLDAYLGEVPESFEYQGKKYTPASLRDEMGLNADDYVSLTSFTHHPFYDEFILEVPDNFSQGLFYNVPIDMLENQVVAALEAGYTVAWDADVSERGFSFREGMAIIPPEGVSRDDLWKQTLREPVITQELRQEGFENYQTTDDHLMHITGMATDQNGKRYFIIKNSWGDGNKYGGKQYVSMSYFRMKTVSILLHKDALMKDLKRRNP